MSSTPHRARRARLRRTRTAGGPGMCAGDVRRRRTCAGRLVAPRPQRRRADTGQSARQHQRLRAGRRHRPASRSFPRSAEPTAAAAPCMTAVANGDDFPFVFNNDSVDAFFGVTSPVYLDELTPWGRHVATIPVPDNQFVTSYSSKSELALNLSPEGNYVSFMGYDAQPGEVDVSNANTPGAIDPGNGDIGPYYRVVAQLDRWGHFTFTRTNAYSGDNGRAAITNDEHGNDLLYTAGNAGQSSRRRPMLSNRRARSSSRRHSCPRPTRTPARRPRSGASTSASSATRSTRPPRTTTSAASRSTTTSSTTRRAAAATASTRCTSSTPPARRARGPGSGCRCRARSCRRLAEPHG